MDQTDDGTYERTLEVDGVAWTVRLMPFGDPAHDHQQFQRVEAPPNGLRFMSAAGRRFFHGYLNPDAFGAMSRDELLDHFRRAAPES
jgi:hypothetical protein